MKNIHWNSTLDFPPKSYTVDFFNAFQPIVTQRPPIKSSYQDATSAPLLRGSGANLSIIYIHTRDVKKAT